MEKGATTDHRVVVYSRVAEKPYKGVAIVIGGIEASLRRIAHYDWWSEKVGFASGYYGCQSGFVWFSVMAEASGGGRALGVSGWSGVNLTDVRGYGL